MGTEGIGIARPEAIIAPGSTGAVAQNKRGEDYYYGRGVRANPTYAVTYFRKAADDGNVDAKFNLGIAYRDGKGVYEADMAKAVKLCTQAANQGHAGAQYELGKAHHEGEGVVKDNAAAVKLWTQAAQQGHAGAQYELGNAYYLGEGVIRSHAAAVSWWIQAAERGNAGAMMNLGGAYESGKGISEDPVAAHTWEELGKLSQYLNIPDKTDGVEKELPLALVKMAGLQLADGKPATDGEMGAHCQRLLTTANLGREHMRKFETSLSIQRAVFAIATKAGLRVEMPEAQAKAEAMA